MDVARPLDPLELRAWSPADVMRAFSKRRLLEFQDGACRETPLQRELAAELEARRQELPIVSVCSLMSAI